MWFEAPSCPPALWEVPQLNVLLALLTLPVCQGHPTGSALVPALQRAMDSGMQLPGREPLGLACGKHLVSSWSMPCQDSVGGTGPLGVTCIRDGRQVGCFSRSWENWEGEGGCTPHHGPGWAPLVPLVCFSMIHTWSGSELQVAVAMACGF